MTARAANQGQRSGGGGMGGGPDGRRGAGSTAGGGGGALSTGLGSGGAFALGSILGRGPNLPQPAPPVQRSSGEPAAAVNPPSSPAGDLVADVGAERDGTAVDGVR